MLILNPEYMVEDCKEMFKNLEYRQFKVGHDALLDPSDNGYATTYVYILYYSLIKFIIVFIDYKKFDDNVLISSCSFAHFSIICLVLCGIKQ
jgi:hypothetical protein